MVTESRQIGPYVLLSRLGEGGMGEVWKARDTRLDRIVAIKTAKTQFSERFEREARAVAALNHPNICILYDVGPDYLVMEFIDGKPLRGPMPFPEIVRLGGQICDALDAAHHARIVHRDLKPANILLAKSGVKLLDFGLAKEVGSLQPNDRTVTIEGTISGTPRYMAPEQIEAKETDARTDIFALGLILHELATGKPAFEAKSYVSMMAAILHEEPIPLNPPVLDAIVRRCLAKDPEQRWQSAADVKHALLLVERAQPLPAKSGKRLAWWLIPVTLALGALVTLVIMPKPGPSLDNLRIWPIANEPRSEGFPRFSPDGKSVAFTRLVEGVDQLYVRSMDSPNPVQLTRVLTGCERPYWSPDGNRIFYLGAGTVWSINAAGGQPLKIQENVTMGWAISPDAQHLLYTDVTRDGNAEFYISSPPGAKPRKLSHTVATSGFASPDFAPDGKSFLVATSEALWRVPLPDGEPKRVMAKTGWWSWHPDGRHIALAAGGGIQLVDTETRRALTILRGTEAITTLHVSPDGSRIAYTSGIADYDLAELSLDGRTISPLLATSRVETGASWSPKGDQYAYLSVFPEEFQVCVRRVSEDRVSVLYSGSVEAMISRVAFSPDGSRIAFCDGARIAVVRANGGPVTTLVTMGPKILVVGPGWSPDGNTIAFISGVQPARLMRADTNGNLTSLTEDAQGGGGSSTSWSSDGKWIAYSAIDGIRIIGPDGKNSRRLTGSRTQAFAFSPDNRSLYRLDRSSENWRLVIQDIASGTERWVPTALPLYSWPRRMSLRPDGKRFLLDISEQKYDIWKVEGVPQPETGIARLWRNWRPAPPGWKDIH